MVARSEIYWANLDDPSGRRPVCVLTRDAAIGVLQAVTCAPITRTIRGIASEVELGPAHGLNHRCVVSCDSLLTVPKTLLDVEPAGRLDELTRAQLDRALWYALDIRY